MKNLIFIFSLFFVMHAGTVFADAVSEDPQERAMLSIASKLRCAVCQNQPVSESHSGLANDMRVIIREQLAAGKSEKEIIDYFVDRYSDYVLMKPRKTGIGFPLWVLPPLLLVFAAGFAWLVMRRRKGADEVPEQMLSNEDRERVRQARKNDKNSLRDGKE